MNKHAHTLAHSVRKNYLTLSGLLFAFFWTWSVVSSSGWQARHSGMDGRRCRPSRKGGPGRLPCRVNSLNVMESYISGLFVNWKACANINNMLNHHMVLRGV